MERRISLAAVALASVAIGCSEPSAARFAGTSEPGFREEGRVAFDIRLENADDAPHVIALEIAHTVAPICRFAAPPCAAPTRTEVVRRTVYTMAPHTATTLTDVAAARTGEIDRYRVAARTQDGGEATLEGVDAGVGRLPAFGESDWRVSGARYRFRITVTDAGAVRMAVRQGGT